jgi:predicted ArsR family transcriptional regulator
VTTATPRQLEVHAFMLAYQRESCAPPTPREIAAHFSFTPTAARDHLIALSKKGLVRHRARVSRGWIALEARA